MLGLEVESVADRARCARALSASPMSSPPSRIPTPSGCASASSTPAAERVQVGLRRAQCPQPVCAASFAPVGSTIPAHRSSPQAVDDPRAVASNGMLCSAYEMEISDDHEGHHRAAAGCGRSARVFAKAAGLDDARARRQGDAQPGRLVSASTAIGPRFSQPAGLGRLILPNIEPIAGSFASPTWVHLATLDPQGLSALHRADDPRPSRNGPRPALVAGPADRDRAAPESPPSSDHHQFSSPSTSTGRSTSFDTGRIEGDLMVRRRPARASAFKALNGKEYVLDGEDDGDRRRCRGAEPRRRHRRKESTGCTEATTDIFIEAALFDPVRTAATGRKLNLQSRRALTASSAVLDPAFVAPAWRSPLASSWSYAAASRASWRSPARRRSGSAATRCIPSGVVTLGGHVDIPVDEQRRILESARLRRRRQGQDHDCGAAVLARRTSRAEADLVEEILRINGYDAIRSGGRSSARRQLPRPALDPAQRRVGFVRRTLAGTRPSSRR